jgi:hypothetical protein
MYWATFWAIFSRTHPVALVAATTRLTKPPHRSSLFHLGSGPQTVKKVINVDQSKNGNFWCSVKQELEESISFW